MDRRKFLAAIAVTPAAVSTAAKSAAAKMGLASVTDFGNGALDLYDNGAFPMSAASDEHWAKKALSEFLLEDNVKDRMNRARHAARVLDPDLSAMVSLSPAVAYQIQVDRCYQRISQEEKRNLLRELRSFSN